MLLNGMLAATTVSAGGLDAATQEIIKGIFSEEMRKITIEAPSNNYMMYTFLIIAVVLILAVVMIVKITSGGMAKGIEKGMEPFVTQIGLFQKSYEDMASKFSGLTQKIVEAQMQRESEDDKFELMFTRFQELHNNNYQYWNQTQQNINECKMTIIHSRDHCAMVGINKMAQRLIDKGLVSKEQVEEILHGLTKGD